MSSFGHSSAVVPYLAALPAHRPGVTGDHTLIHIAGITAYIAFYSMAATVIWGALLASRLLDDHMNRATLYGGHVTLAILALSSSSLHAILHVFRHDTFFDMEKVWLPWLGGADTVVSIGIVGLEIVIVVGFSVWFQRRISYRRWLHLHRWAYPGFALIALHSALASKEQHFGFIWATFALMMLAVIYLTVNRVVSPAVETPQDAEAWFDFAD
jgi:DMSO/TMAO reductase YedYZ heme-binding membrane subunit